MEFGLPAEATELRDRVREFVSERVIPVEAEAIDALDDEVAADIAFPRMIEALRAQAREEGLWNLYMPEPRYGPGLSNVAYAALSEEMGRSPFVAPYVFNCQPPDSGNAEILAEHGTAEQRAAWLEPLLEGRIRTCFSMTEPQTAGSDPTGLACRAELDGEEWVINGRKWWTTNALGAAVAIVMCVSDPEAAPHARATMILVPTDAPGFDMVRPLKMMGHDRGPGHWEIAYEDCRVPAANTLGERGGGFKVAQDRLGPGRIHHCMRLIGVAERAFELMCRRANEREMFGGVLADKQFVQDFVARSRIEINQARLITQHAAWRLDTVGKREARQDISIVKVAVANMVMEVLDRAIQVHGSLGMCDDTPLAYMWRFNRMLRIGDGPDEVHKQVIARRELRAFAAG